MSLSIVAEVIKAIEIAKTVSYKPLADKILMSCIDVLKELQSTGEQKAPQLCSEYEFRQTMLPYLKRLHPDNAYEALRTQADILWIRYRHLANLDLIVSAAHSEAVREASPDISLLRISIPLRKESTCEADC
jgi:hypothetical protein